MCIWQLSLGQNLRTTMHAILCKLQTAKLRASSWRSLEELLLKEKERRGGVGVGDGAATAAALNLLLGFVGRG